MLTNITPEHLRCSLGGCPAVFKREDGMIVVVGKKTDAQKTPGLEGAVAPDEDAIVIHPEYLHKLTEQPQTL